VDEADLVERAALLDTYVSWMRERNEGSREYADLQAEQAQCMTVNGYGSILTIDDLNVLIFDIEERWLAGSLSYEEALLEDQRVGVT